MSSTVNANAVNNTTTTPKIRKPALKRLCRRAGIKRLDGQTYGEIRTTLNDFLKPIIRQSILVMRYSGRKTVTSDDVVMVMKNNQSPIYGV